VALADWGLGQPQRSRSRKRLEDLLPEVPGTGREMRRHAAPPDKRCKGARSQPILSEASPPPLSVGSWAGGKSARGPKYSGVVALLNCSANKHDTERRGCMKSGCATKYSTSQQRTL